MGKIVDVENIPYIYPVDDEGNEGDGIALESCILDDEIVPPIKAYSQEEVVAMLEELKASMNKLKKLELSLCGKEERSFSNKCQEIIQKNIDAIQLGSDKPKWLELLMKK